MDIASSAKVVPRRGTKIETFLRKQFGLIGYLRFYEPCVLDKGGTLMLQYAVLTEDSFIITENPPKTIQHMIPFSDIIDFYQVADRRSVVSGGKNSSFVSQHCRILYKQRHLPELTRKKRHSISSSRDTDVRSQASMSTSFSASSPFTLSSSLFQNNVPRYNVPEVMHRLYETPMPSANFDSSFHHSEDSGLSLSPTASLGYEELKDTGCFTTSSAEEQMSPQRKNRNGTKSRSLSVREVDSGLGDDRPYLSSKLSNHVQHEHRHHEKISLSQLLNDSSCANSIVDGPSPPIMWNGKSEERASSNQRESSSSQALFLSSSTKPPSLFTRILRRRTDKMRNGTSNGNSLSSGSTGSSSSTKYDDAHNKIHQLDIYLYIPNSSLMNEISLSWHRQLLVSTLRLDMEAGLCIENGSLRAAEAVLDTIVQQNAFIWNEDKTTWRQQHASLCILHKCLLRFTQLKRICWKRRRFVTTLLVILKQCTQTMSTDRGQVTFLDRLVTFSLVMEIFRLLFESSSAFLFIQTNDISDDTASSSSLMNINISEVVDHKMARVNVAKMLMINIFSFPESFHKDGLDDYVLKVLSSPLKFMKGSWMTSYHSDVIRMVALGHNVCVAVLYEILSLVHFSPKCKERSTFFETLPLHSMDLFVKQLVTQIVVTQWSPEVQLTGTECILLYKQTTVLKTLMDHVPHLKGFLHSTFCEEFQYSVHPGSSLNVTDRFPIKEKLIKACDQIRQDITHFGDDVRRDKA